jgi:acyl-CoA synthetase (AMP-forming)/AMP-acid ligase II
VLKTAVTVMLDKQEGEWPKAFVSLKEGEEATEDEIIDSVKERIARFKAPAAVELASFPRQPPTRFRSSSCVRTSRKAKNSVSANGWLIINRAAS